jgi:two-component system response regulator FixJ
VIYIVDDDEATRDSLRLLLEAEGFAACEFAAGRLFLDDVQPANGDCLILDVNMPGMSGLDVLEELRRQGQQLPIIIITARLDNATRNRALAGGALAVVEKPPEIDDLLAFVRIATGTGS